MRIYFTFGTFRCGRLACLWFSSMSSSDAELWFAPCSSFLTSSVVDLQHFSILKRIFGTTSESFIRSLLNRKLNQKMKKWKNLLLTVRAHYRINFNMMNSDPMDDALSEFLKRPATERACERFFSFMGFLMLRQFFCCVEDLAAENTFEIVHRNHFLRINFFHLFSGAHQRYNILQVCIKNVFAGYLPFHELRSRD